MRSAQFVAVFWCLGASAALAQSNPAFSAGSREAYSLIVADRNRTAESSAERELIDARFKAAREAAEKNIRALLESAASLEYVPRARELVEQAARAREAAIAKAREELNTLESDLVEFKRATIGRHPRSTAYSGGVHFDYDREARRRRYVSFDSAAIKKKEVAALQTKIKDARSTLAELSADGSIVAPLIPIDGLGLGGMGLLFVPSRVALRRGDGKGYQVIQVTGPQEMLVQIFGKPVWVKGVSTAGVVDDARIDLPQLFHVCGTKQYRSTAGSTRTVFALEAIQFPSAQAKE